MYFIIISSMRMMQCYVRQTNITLFLILYFSTLNCQSGEIPTTMSEKEDGIFELVREGKTKYVIIQSNNATEIEKEAIRDLSHFLTKVSGAAFPIVTESSKPNHKNAIYVGWTQFALQNGIDCEGLGEEEWIIRFVDDNLILTGGRPRGTLYGVYEFLENQVGCHWLSWDSEIIPNKPTLTFVKCSIRQKPFMWRREIMMGYSVQKRMATKEMKNQLKWFRIRNKDNSVKFHGWYPIQSRSIPIIHTFSYYVNASKWFKSHPEYFSLNKEGRRSPSKSGFGPGQLCLTNPDVRRITLKNLRNFIKRDRIESTEKQCPYPKIYDISQNDRNTHCVCRNCQSIASKEGSESGPLIDFINAVAEKIEKEFPDIFIQTLAYNQTSKPPTHLSPRRNVIIKWCDVYPSSNLLLPLSHQYNSRHYKEISGWGEIASHLAIHDYWIPYSTYWFPTPFSMIQSLVADMKLFADFHVHSFFTESQEESPFYRSAWNSKKMINFVGGRVGNPGQNFINLKYWLAYKLMVNPYLDTKPLINTFMVGYYGAAAPEMTNYLNYLEQRTNADIDSEMRIFLAPHKLNYLDLTFFSTSEMLFNQAIAKVEPGSLSALHVMKERLVVDGALLYLWPWLEHRLPAEEKMPFNHETVIRRYEDNWSNYTKYFFSEKAQNLCQNRITSLTSLFRNPNLPEKFRNLNPRDVADFNWTTFNLHTWAHQILPDLDANGGKASLLVRMSDQDYKKPLLIGGRGLKPFIIEFDEIPQDEKYHLYALGRLKLDKWSKVWLCAKNKLTVDLSRVWVQNAKDHRTNEWDVYISLKFKGPAYVKDSVGNNQIWMDRVLLVKPQ